ncbi:integrase [Salibacterium salarium]|nr:hypothetical protein [Salibacterium salarium]MDQ0300407.1 integrase [Salibacterium salarium]
MGYLETGTIDMRLGHADIKTTMNIYSYVLRSAEHEAAKHFTGLFVALK